jgi:hypothetical protein
LRVFLGWLRGERGHCSMVAVPTIEEEDARPGREREALVAARTRITNGMKVHMARLGVHGFKAHPRSAPKKLGSVRTPKAWPSRPTRWPSSSATWRGSPCCASRSPLSSKRGSSVRRGMIQLAWRWLTFQKESALALWFKARVDGAPGLRKTMVMALARKLLIALWRMATIGEVPQGVVMRAAA